MLPFIMPCLIIHVYDVAVLFYDDVSPLHFRGVAAYYALLYFHAAADNATPRSAAASYALLPLFIQQLLLLTLFYADCCHYVMKYYAMLLCLLMPLLLTLLLLMPCCYTPLYAHAAADTAAVIAASMPPPLLPYATPMPFSLPIYAAFHMPPMNAILLMSLLFAFRHADRDAIITIPYVLCQLAYAFHFFHADAYIRYLPCCYACCCRCHTPLC